MSLDLAVQPFEHIADWARRDPHRICLQTPDHKLTFGEVHDFALRLVTQLRSLGVKPGHTVALDVPVGILPFFVAACLHEATVFLMYRSQLENATPVTADFLLSTSRTESRMAERTITVNRDFLQAAATAEPAVGVAPYPNGSESNCYIAFSSGTTGRAKAVMMTSEMLHQRAVATRDLFAPSSQYLCSIGVGALAGFDTFYAALLNGDCFYVGENAAAHLGLIRRHKISGLKCSPIQLAELVAEAQKQQVGLDSLSHIYAAGSVVPMALRQQVAESTSAELWTIYGSTEAGRATKRLLNPTTLGSERDHGILDSTSAHEEIGNVGAVIPGTTLEIVDDQDSIVGSGEDGIVRYQRYRQTTGYLGDESATQEFFRNGWFYPGDRGHLTSTGELVLTGRTSELVNVGGVKVDMFEVEQFVVRLEGVFDAAGFLFQNSAGLESFGLAVVAQDAFSSAQLAQTLHDTFGANAPSALMRLEVIPRNAMGKVDRQELSSQFLQRS